MSHGLLYRLRLWLMWRVAPVERKTVAGGLRNLTSEEYPEEYDTAGQLAYLLGILTESAFNEEDDGR